MTMNNFVTVGKLFAPSPMYVTGFAKIVPKGTTAEIHYTLTHENDTYACTIQKYKLYGYIWLGLRRYYAGIVLSIIGMPKHKA